MSNSLVKEPGDDRAYVFDFSNVEEILNGETIVSATATVSPSGLTLGTPTISSPLISVEIHGGTSGQSYDLKITAHTSGGYIYVEIIPFVVL